MPRACFALTLEDDLKGQCKFCLGCKSLHMYLMEDVNFYNGNNSNSIVHHLITFYRYLWCGKNYIEVR